MVIDTRASTSLLQEPWALEGNSRITEQIQPASYTWHKEEKDFRTTLYSDSTIGNSWDLLCSISTEFWTRERHFKKNKFHSGFSKWLYLAAAWMYRRETDGSSNTLLLQVSKHHWSNIWRIQTGRFQTEMLRKDESEYGQIHVHITGTGLCLQPKKTISTQK